MKRPCSNHSRFMTTLVMQTKAELVSAGLTESAASYALLPYVKIMTAHLIYANLVIN